MTAGPLTYSGCLIIQGFLNNFLFTGVFLYAFNKKLRQFTYLKEEGQLEGSIRGASYKYLAVTVDTIVTYCNESSDVKQLYRISLRVSVCAAPS